MSDTKILTGQVHPQAVFAAVVDAPTETIDIGLMTCQVIWCLQVEAIHEKASEYTDTATSRRIFGAHRSPEPPLAAVTGLPVETRKPRRPKHAA